MTTVYKRAYKACESCRRTKVRCEVEEGGTSCSRCVRERRQCLFPAQRSAKRTKASIAKSLSKRKNGSVWPQGHLIYLELTCPKKNIVPSDQAGGHEITIPEDTATDSDLLKSQSLTIQEPEQEDTTHSVQNIQSEVLETLVTNPRDAMGLLFKAAEHSTSDSSDESVASRTSRQDEISSSIYSMPSPALASSEALGVWEKHRFVRQGWFTPHEAVSYIEL